MPMKKIKNHLCWNVRGRLKVLQTIFWVFSSRKQGNKYVQNTLFAPMYIMLKIQLYVDMEMPIYNLMYFTKFIFNI
jgi:hypothetical protein